MDAPQARRVAQGLASQGISSVSNFALVVMVARSATTEEFGAFAVAYSMALLLLGASRGVVGETLAVTLSGRRARREETSAAVGAAALVGLVGGVLIAIAGMLWPHEGLRIWLLVFAPGVPLLIVQDAVRHVGFATQRPNLAAISDAVWLGFQLLGWLVLSAVAWLTGPMVTVVWWAAGGLAALLVFAATGTPVLGSGGAWLYRHRRLSFSFGLETLMYLGSAQGTVYAVGLAAGLPAAGALRGAQSIYGPLRAVASGVTSIALPETSRRQVEDGRNAMIRYAFRVSTTLTVLGVCALIVLSLLPDEVGRELLSGTWSDARRVMPAVGLSLVGGMGMIGARLGLRAIHATSEVLYLRLVTSALAFIFGVGGAFWGGLVPAAYGLALAHLLTAGLGWAVMWRVSSVGQPGSAPPS